jgi:phage terminase large subunit-like protein
LFELYPDEGPLRRELYPKHVQFFAAGATYRERAVMAGNRTGKSFGMGGYETALHLTGLYPAWWPGRRFTRPIDAWAAGDTSETTRDIVQKILTGVGGDREGGELGTGLIPGDKFVGEPSRRAGVPGAFDTISVRHTSGGISSLGLKSYDQGRKKFQGTSKDLVWLDEEPPRDVYTECITRTMTTNGMILCTFTPLEGLTDVALMFMPDLAPAPDTAH